MADSKAAHRVSLLKRWSTISSRSSVKSTRVTVCPVVVFSVHSRWATQGSTCTIRWSPRDTMELRPDRAHPAQAEPLPVAVGGKMVVEQRRETHPLHLLKQQRDVVNALCDDVGYLIHAQSLAQSAIYLQIWANRKYPF